MTVERIIPCICCEHTPNSGDRCDYGMPILIPLQSYMPTEHKQLWNIKCPNCGRGGMYEEKSPYLALKKWNELQERLHKFEDIYKPQKTWKG